MADEQDKIAERDRELEEKVKANAEAGILSSINETDLNLGSNQEAVNESNLISIHQSPRFQY